MHNSWGPPQTCTCCCRPLFLTIWLPYKVNYHHLIRLPFNLSFLWSPDHLEKWCRPSGNKSPSCCPYMSNLEPRWRMRMTCLGVSGVGQKNRVKDHPPIKHQASNEELELKKILAPVTSCYSTTQLHPLYPTVSDWISIHPLVHHVRTNNLNHSPSDKTPPLHLATKKVLLSLLDKTLKTN